MGIIQYCACRQLLDSPFLSDEQLRSAKSSSSYGAHPGCVVFIACERGTGPQVQFRNSRSGRHCLAKWSQHFCCLLPVWNTRVNPEVRVHYSKWSSVSQLESGCNKVGLTSKTVTKPSVERACSNYSLHISDSQGTAAC